MRDRDDLSLALALDGYWDELVRGEPAGSPARARDPHLDPGLAATLRQIHDLDAAPSAAPAFAARLWGDLMDAQGLATASLPRVRPDRPPAAGAPPMRFPIPNDSVPLGRRVPAWLATAALLLLTLGAGFLAFGPGRPGADRPEGIPAVVASPATPPPATPDAMPGEETLTAADDALLAKILGPDVVPGEGAESVELVFGVYSPGFTGEFPGAQGACCPGLVVDYTVAGSYRLRADRPFQVRRAAEPGRWVDQSAGAEVTLAAGDAVAYGPGGRTIANPGSTPVHLVSAIVTAADASSVEAEEPVVTHRLGIVPAPTASLHTVELTLRRETLAAGATLPAPPPGSHQAVVGGPGDPGLGQHPGGSVENLRDEARPVYVLTLRPTGAAAATAPA